MPFIPDAVYDEFIAEISMYENHLNVVIKYLEAQNLKIEEEFGRIASGCDPETADEGVIWARASENILKSDTMFIPHYQIIGAIAGYCIVLFHLFERWVEEIAFFDTGKRINGFLEFLNEYPNFKTQPSLAKIEELRCLVNYCKHGQGSGEAKLRELRPDYFSGDVIRFRQVMKPLSGYDIRIRLDDFKLYKENLTAFVAAVKLEFNS